MGDGGVTLAGAFKELGEELGASLAAERAPGCSLGSCPGSRDLAWLGAARPGAPRSREGATLKHRR